MSRYVCYRKTVTNLTNGTEHSQLKKKKVNMSSNCCAIVISNVKWHIAVSYMFDIEKCIDVLVRNDTIYIGIYNEDKKLTKEIIYSDFKII